MSINCRPIERRAASIYLELAITSRIEVKTEGSHKHIDGHFSVNVIHVDVTVDLMLVIVYLTKGLIHIQLV